MDIWGKCLGLVVKPTGLASLRGAGATWQSIVSLLGFTQPTVFNCKIRSGLLRAELLFPRNDVELVVLHTKPNIYPRNDVIFRG